MSLAWAELPAPEPIGALTVGVSDRGLALVCFGAGPGARRRVDEAARRLSGTDPVADRARTGEVAAELAAFLRGGRRRLEVPVDWRLTSGDQRTVLGTLHRLVGYGETVTYGELAVRSGAYPPAGPRDRGLAARRVGAVMASNPLPVVVPCHRVLAADGLGGFGGGLPVKRWLLGLEGSLPPVLDLWPGGAPGLAEP